MLNVGKEGEGRREIRLEEGDEMSMEFPHHDLHDMYMCMRKLRKLGAFEGLIEPGVVTLVQLIPENSSSFNQYLIVHPTRSTVHRIFYSLATHHQKSLFIH